MEEFGKKLRDARKHLGISQTALAKSLGVSRMTINNWEVGRHLPRRRKFIQILQLFADRGVLPITFQELQYAYHGTQPVVQRPVFT